MVELLKDKGEVIMIAENYACAYKEVLEILKYTKKEDVAKIPEQEIEFYNKYMKKSHNFKVDPSKPFQEQKLSEEARAILANIYKEHWATDYQRERIEAKERYDMEQMAREMYNPDNVFANKKKETLDGVIADNVAMVEYKESIFRKLINKIKDIFTRKKF